MDLRVQQVTGKFALDADGALRTQQLLSKFAVFTGAAAALRTQQVIAKFAVRTFPLIRFAKLVPPMDITISQAPYIRTERRS